MSLQDHPTILDDLDIQSAEKKLRLKIPLMILAFGLILILTPLGIMQTFSPQQFAEFANLPNNSSAERLVIGALVVGSVIFVIGIIVLVVTLVVHIRQRKKII